MTVSPHASQCNVTALPNGHVLYELQKVPGGTDCHTGWIHNGTVIADGQDFLKDHVANQTSTSITLKTCLTNVKFQKDCLSGVGVTSSRFFFFLLLPLRVTTADQPSPSLLYLLLLIQVLTSAHPQTFSLAFRYSFFLAAPSFYQYSPSSPLDMSNFVTSSRLQCLPPTLALCVMCSLCLYRLSIRSSALVFGLLRIRTFLQGITLGFGFLLSLLSC